jgi:protein phosphatase
LALQEKHLGSRALVLVCRDAAAARARFGTVGDDAGAIWTRTGRAFFSDRATSEAVLARARVALETSGLWRDLASDWALLDCEIMPWSAKAQSLIDGQYAPVAAAAQAGLAAALDAAKRAQERGVDVGALRDRLAGRAERAARFTEAWAPYVWPVADAHDLRIAPFHLLASEGSVHFDKDHRWHMEAAERLVSAGAPMFAATSWRALDLASETACADAVEWWENIARRGGEGMVAKPIPFAARGEKGLIQPALKVRGREYLRIIYGPEYDASENLARLRVRGLGAKRALALREFALGHEALSRFVAREPLRRVHECVFAVLALESEPVDPRL